MDPWESGEGAVDFGEQEARLNQSEAKADLYDRYAEAYFQLEELKARKNELESDMEAARLLIIDELKSEGVKSKKLENGRTFGLVRKRYYKANDKGALVEWCLDTGKRDMLSVHHGTLQSRMKELDVDMDLPPKERGESQVPECVGFFEEDGLRVTGMKRRAK